MLNKIKDPRQEISRELTKKGKINNDTLFIKATQLNEIISDITSWSLYNTTADDIDLGINYTIRFLQALQEIIEDRKRLEYSGEVNGEYIECELKLQIIDFK